MELAVLRAFAKHAAAKKIGPVYSYVPKKSLPHVMQSGLHGSESLLKNPKLLAVVAKERGVTPEQLAANIRKNLASWRGNSLKGPNIVFSLIPKDQKLSDKHPTKEKELVPVKINLKGLMKAEPKTKAYGLELRPYDKKDRERRHRFLSKGEVGKLTKIPPKKLWSRYSDPDDVGYYAPDVPHASIHTPSGYIPPKFITKVKKASQ